MNGSYTKYFPRWYIVNDLCIVLFNLITILIGMTFIILFIREKKLRTVINILSTNSCLCGSLLALAILWDAFYMLKTDISGISRQDRTCVTRTICMLLTMNALNYSLW
jgi:amino acid transporter